MIDNNKKSKLVVWLQYSELQFIIVSIDPDRCSIFYCN